MRVQSRLACVVISFRGREDVVRAVRSLVEQDVTCEIVVVNSGGNSPRRRLLEACLDVDVLDVAQPLTPGGARNVGVAATRAPFVAFLAGDCWAAPGWVAGRLRAHTQGARAVAARLVNPYPHSAVACAFHLAIHGRRLVPGRRSVGLSYERAWLERSGSFRATTLGGEDTDMRRRLGPAAEIPAPPAVVTFHDHPTELSALTREAIERGRRVAAEARRYGRPADRRPVPLQGADNVLGGVLATLGASGDMPAREVLRGLPLALPAAAVFGAAALLPDASQAAAGDLAIQRRAASATSAASAPPA